MATLPCAHNRMEKIPVILEEVNNDFITRLPITDGAFLLALREKGVITGGERRELDSKPNARDKRSFILDALSGKQSLDPYIAFREILQKKAPDLFKKLQDAEKECGLGESPIVVFVC